MVLPDPLHNGHQRCPMNFINYNRVHPLSVMEYSTLVDISVLLIESATKAPNGTFDTGIDVP